MLHLSAQEQALIVAYRKASESFKAAVQKLLLPTETTKAHITIVRKEI